jgi:FtsZ-binding cell division protein ZapB
MITLEQTRLLEGKIERAIELIRILKEENATLRKGLDSAQKRMKELETMVDGFKSDQKEIESVILRTIKNLDELEESTQAAAHGDSASPGFSPSGRKAESRPAAGRSASLRQAGDASVTPDIPIANHSQSTAANPAAGAREAGQGTGRIEPLSTPEAGNSDREDNKGELDIF